jgi:hypothetical protein
VNVVIPRRFGAGRVYEPYSSSNDVADGVELAIESKKAEHPAFVGGQ